MKFDDLRAGDFIQLKKGLVTNEYYDGCTFRPDMHFKGYAKIYAIIKTREYKAIRLVNGYMYTKAMINCGSAMKGTHNANEPQSAYKLHVGDYVKLKTTLKVGHRYNGITFLDVMDVKRKLKICEIDFHGKQDCAVVLSNGYYYSIPMLNLNSVEKEIKDEETNK